MQVGSFYSSMRDINKQNFKGLIPLSQLRELASKNTPEAKEMLHSCIGFNAVYRGAQNLNPDKIARAMADKFNMHCEFGNNPIVASFSALTANIFRKLGLVNPTGVYLKNLDRTYYSNALGLCATNRTDDALFRKFGKDFPLRSVIINDSVDWYDIQQKMIYQKKVNHSSTSHFLATFIHEYIHSAHLYNLIKKYGDGSKVMRKLQKDFTNKDTIALIQKETSNYGATKPCELIAEELTELIVNSLNPKTIMPNELLFKLERSKEPLQMDVLIDACWNGNISAIKEYVKKKNKLIEWIKVIV